RPAPPAAPWHPAGGARPAADPGCGKPLGIHITQAGQSLRCRGTLAPCWHFQEACERNQGHVLRILAGACDVKPMASIGLGTPQPAAAPATLALEAQTPADRYRQVRAATLALCSRLAPEDYVAQSMPDASPATWHLPPPSSRLA